MAHTVDQAPSTGITPDPGSMIERGELWLLALNRNQNLLGKTMLVALRPVERVSALTPAEWADLHVQLRRVTAALERAFQPDHFNYAFLQNADRQVHLHIIPRYAVPRTFAGLTFADADYPEHYAVPAPPRALDVQQRDALRERIRAALASEVV